MNMNPKWYEATFEASFKTVAGGYVFQAPSPWVFGRGRRYLVNDAQKMELLSLMKPKHLRNLMIWLAIALLALAASTVLWAFSGHDQMMTSDALAIFAVIAVSSIVAIVMVTKHDLRRLQPVLIGALRTQE